MPNPNIRIKSAAGSLARRAVFVSLCLLVAPLFLHSLFLFWEDDRHHLTEVSSRLRLIAEAQASLLEQRLRWQWQVLDAAVENRRLREQLRMNTLPIRPDAPEYFAAFSTAQNEMIVGRKIGAASALAIATPESALFHALTRFEYAEYPISLALIDREGKTLAGAKQETSLFVKLPVEGADFFIYLSIPERAARELKLRSYWGHFLSLLAFVGGLGGILVWIVTRRIAKPLRTLCRTMDKVAQGAIHARYEPDRMGFEINELGKRFNDTLDRLLHHQQEAERERIARERLAEELKIGHEIQISLLPSALPHLKGVEIAQGFLPAREVGGDFYDFFSLDSGSLLIAIADAAGKGISACLYSLGLRSALRTLAATKHGLSEMVRQANELFLRDADQSGMFITLWIGVYHPKTGELEYCSLGHPPAFLLQAGALKELTTGGAAIGTAAFEEVLVKRIVLSHGDMLLLYTDGIIEAHDAEDRLFGMERLRNILLHSSGLSAAQLAERVLQEVAFFDCGASRQHDDMTLVVLRVAP